MSQQHGPGMRGGGLGPVAGTPTHTHQNNGEGGTLDAAAIAAGTMATARLGSGTADQYAALFGSQAWLPVVKFEAFSVLYTDFSGFGGTAGTKSLKTSLPAGTMILATGVLKNAFMTAGMGTSVDCDIGTVTDSDLFMAATPCGATSGTDHLQPTEMPKIVGSGQDIVFRLFNASFNLNTMTGGDLTVLIAYAVP